MSLDVYIVPMPLRSLKDSPREYVSSFDDDGYYSFLFPLFEELSEKTGQLIDLYDGALFDGEELDALAQTLAKARALVERQPEQWEVVVALGGIRIPTTNKISEEIRETVSKVRMTALLDALEAATRKASSTKNALLFFGD